MSQQPETRHPTSPVACDSMSLYDVSINGLHGEPLDLHTYEDRLVLLVNVASRCGLTPQYEGLQRLHRKYDGRGFTVLGVPCNQFLGSVL